MKLALLSDVHANLRALHACLAHARAAGATRFALLGDLVGYGAEPAQVVDEAMALAQAGAIVLRGNHEAAALVPPADPRTAEAGSSRWTHGELGAAHQAFLAALPLTAILGSAFLVHASADEPDAWHYVDSPRRAALCLDAATQDPQVRHVFCGHVHEQRLYYRGRGRTLMAFDPAAGAAAFVPPSRTWLATVGSVGQPRDGDPRAMYALFDAREARLTFQRVAYDHLGAADAVRRAGLPESFALRLEEGR
jgi:diadenosine tetraphosphatase ApaH/serine/threonine PP2A family protein phosphatase